jgi:glycine cleavage system pyridoxal-binding protein P
MRYISNTAAQQKEMLGIIGADSIEDLLVRIPTKARLSTAHCHGHSRRKSCRAKPPEGPT